jgi:hypothetical protein
MNSCEPKDMIIGLATILLALIPFNYYFSSVASLEFKSFTKCNRRFDEINELLDLVHNNHSKKSGEDKLTEVINYNGNIKTNKQIILDYLDLCAEEYYLYKYSGIISNKIWKHWLNGMLYYFEKEGIFYKVLADEKGKDSYYQFIEYMLIEIEKLSKKRL